MINLDIDQKHARTKNSHPKSENRIATREEVMKALDESFKKFDKLYRLLAKS